MQSASKKDQRKKYLDLRKNIDFSKKEEKDLEIFNNIISSKEYQSNEIILTFVSINFEVDTRKLIEYSLSIGKKVYAPYVTKEKLVMEFHRLYSIDELIENKMGILEPIPKEKFVFDDISKTLCIVPALVYDTMGFRIGYGGGYYDYFLEKNKCNNIGIIYEDFVIDEIPREEFDISVDKIISNKKIRQIHY